MTTTIDTAVTAVATGSIPLATLTTGQIALAFDVAPLTASRWIDRGLLRGYRLPGSKDRRATLDEVLAFAKANNLPTTHPLLNPAVAA